MRELILPVTTVRTETPFTRIVRLAFDGAAFPFRAGQSATIGPAESAHRVPYSLACSPDEARTGRYLEFLIKVEPSGRWGHRFDRIARGQRLAVRGPFGSFGLPSRTILRPMLFVAGGTGIAPVRSMVMQALGRRHGPLSVLYSARAASELAYARELRRLARNNRVSVRFHATRDAPRGWRGERGRITAAHLEPVLESRSTLCFVCGPSAMVADLPLLLRRVGVPGRNIRLETWSSS